jgi:hypothetical protein
VRKTAFNHDTDSKSETDRSNHCGVAKDEFTEHGNHDDCGGAIQPTTG